MEAVAFASEAARKIDEVFGPDCLAVEIFDVAIRREIAKASVGGAFDITPHLTGIRGAAKVAAAMPQPNLFSAPSEFRAPTRPETAAVPDEQSPEPLPLFIDPGGASIETIQEVLEAINGLHLAAGGSGLRFEPDDSGTCKIVGVTQ